MVAKVRGLNDDDLEQWEFFVDVEVAALREEWAVDLGGSHFISEGSPCLSRYSVSPDEEDSSGPGSLP